MKKDSISTMAGVSGQHDDISMLAEAFSLTAVHYIDIARDERLENILACWPLLQEMAPDKRERD